MVWFSLKTMGVFERLRVDLVRLDPRQGGSSTYSKGTSYGLGFVQNGLDTVSFFFDAWYRFSNRSRRVEAVTYDS